MCRILWLSLVLAMAGFAVAAGSYEMNSLLAIKSGVEDPEGRLRGWSSANSTVCSWAGVLCNASGAVTGLDLSGFHLGGTIAPEIQQLSASLLSLNVSNNNFSGPLPSAFTNLTRLRFLDISHNAFEGSLPAGFFRLKSLLNFTAYSNSFTGSLPLEFLHLSSLQHFDLSGSYFSGPIPAEYGGLSSVEYLDLSGNLLNGSIPPQLGSLRAARFIKIGWNHIMGSIPPELGNLSATLESLDLAGARLTGAIPAELGRLSILSTLFLYKNNLSGAIPFELGNLSSLVFLDLSQNMLTGEIPSSLGNLRELSLLSLMYNNLGGVIPLAIADLPNLSTLLIWNNSFSGHLPQHLGRMSPLVWFDASANQLSGPIPPALCAAGKLFKLMLFSNRLTGSIPIGLADCASLWRLRLEDNQLNGTIPHGFGALNNLTYLDVSHNKLSGPLPGDLLHAPMLQNLDVSFNPLHCRFPNSIWKMKSLQKLNASFCNITGGFWHVEQCPPLLTLDLSGNLLTGNLSSGLARCQRLTLLNLRFNKLSGQIPVELAGLPVLSTLELSYNKLNGSIPVEFGNSTALEVFDVSYNDLSGTVPSKGLFKVINPDMLAGNDGLCGGILGTCNTLQNELLSPNNGSRKRSLGLMAWVVAGIFAMTLLILMAGFRCFYKQYKWYICSKLRQDRDQDGWKLTAFQRLSFTVEDIVRCLTTNNIIGMGAAGTVYRADMPGGEVIAVKKLWRSQKEVDVKDQHILGEVDVLGSVRHRNIVRLLGCCSSSDTTLLLYEYMPNGSLGDLLHGNKEANLLADWMTRYKIAMGVAQGLCYLHHDCFPVVVHRDVKSNNILLDSNMEARVADFGVAKLIEETESMSVIAGSYGYIAPEYAYTMQVDEKSDIYSFGVVLLELLTGKRPVEAEYGDAVSIAEWVREKVEGGEEAVAEVLGGEAAAPSWVREEMALVLRVALLCTSKAPIDRPSMRDVVSMLSEAKPRRKQPHGCPSTTAAAAATTRIL
ncbi:hypothetical protein KP509_02G032800 [Ceratopteris richardii]|uniref:non-specific serine/threonine protein kinase n=1 Tax=Ceratopteris richardii TaxID=49495 RepID=A0A8T2V4K6_CERRI|nr:hypothetical protein KP509_02G032800 [Ceratopteris richardii]